MVSACSLETRNPKIDLNESVACSYLYRNGKKFLNITEYSVRLDLLVKKYRKAPKSDYEFIFIACSKFVIVI